MNQHQDKSDPNKTKSDLPDKDLTIKHEPPRAGTPDPKTVHPAKDEHMKHDHGKVNSSDSKNTLPNKDPQMKTDHAKDTGTHQNDAKHEKR